MGRSLVIIVSDSPEVIQKAHTLGMNQDVSVKVFTPEQWRSHIEDNTFRKQLYVGEMKNHSGGTVLPFPGAAPSGDMGKSVSTINDLESMAIKNAIFEYNGNLTEAAKALGIGRATLYRKVKQYNIDPSLARKRGPKAA